MSQTAIDAALSGEPNLENCEVLIRAFQELVESAPWKVYCSIVEKQQVVRLDSIVLTPLQSLDAALEQEYAKGEIAGMRTAVQLPSTMLATLLDQLPTLREERDRQESEGEPK